MPGAAPEHVSSLLEEAVHTQHKPLDRNSLPGAGDVHVKTVKQKMLVPREEVVKVPVVRKERVKRVESRVVKGQKLIPRKKFKEVEETVIEVREEMVNGRVEKRAHPVKRTRMVPYMDYEPEEVEIRVDVPVEEVVTRTGYRHDRHIVSDVVEVEEDHVYELRPVFVRSENSRITEREPHHVVKTQHGKPMWDGDVLEGWLGRPITPLHRPEVKRLERPTTGNSIRSIASAVGKHVALGSRSLDATSMPRNMSTGMLGSGGIRSPSYVQPRTTPTMGIRRVHKLDQTSMPRNCSVPSF